MSGPSGIAYRPGMDDPPLPKLALPLTIRAMGSSYIIRDATGLCCGYVAFDTDASLAATRQLPLPDDALAIARVYARSLTAATEAGRAPASR